MPLDRLLHNGQADPAALYPVTRLQCLENLKDTLMILWSDAGTVVCDGKLHIALLLARTDFHDPFPRPVMMLDGVADQVAKHGFERRAFGPQFRQFAGNPHREAGRGRQDFHDAVDKFSHVDRLGCVVLAAHTGVCQQVVEQGFHPADTALQLGQV